MEETFSAQAIILKRVPDKEDNLAVLVYTDTHGLLSLTARGARKKGSKVAGHIEPFNLTRIMVIRGKNREYLGSAQIIDSYGGIKDDLKKLEIAGRAWRVFIKLMHPNEPDKNIFNLLQNFLETLNDAPQADKSLYYSWAWRLIRLLGYDVESLGKSGKVSLRQIEEQVTKIINQ